MQILHFYGCDILWKSTFFHQKFPLGGEVSENRNIWGIIAPIVALPEPKQPQTLPPKPEHPQTLPPKFEQPQTPFVETTMTMNKGSMTGDLQLQSPKLLVYSRQKNTQKVEHLMNPLQNHDFKPISGTQTSNPRVTSRGDDLNVPIALRKGTRSCT